MTVRDPWGTPYDPSNGGGFFGKILREKATELREREQHRLRGCRDPGCTVCNPETAALGARSPDVTISRARDFTVYVDSIQLSGFRDDPNDRVRSGSPPYAFTEAREAVKKWLVTPPQQSFDDILGNDAALGQLRDAIEAPVKQADLYKAYAMKMPRGALLSGPPGCGKTMFARAAASEMKRLYGADVEFISISGSELQSMYVGETEARIKAIFTFAREYKAYRGHPLLVFMDEAEVLLPDRTGRARRLAPWEESQVATFLAEMDGMQESGAFVLLATNRPEVIDQAVLRDGRCDFKIEVERPTSHAVEQILRKGFVGVLLGEDSIDNLVFAAMEALYDPQRILIQAMVLKVRLKAGDVDLDSRGKHFLLEHIISGAIAASVPARATRHAFARDKAAGVATGVSAADVVRAVGDIFEENKRLDHSFALEAFKRDFMAEVAAADADRKDAA